MLGCLTPNDRVSVHTFCDASKIAYAAVVFMRVESSSEIRVNFIQAKARIAPLKKNSSDSRHSIPRLELLTATIRVRLTTSILESLKLNNVEVFYWSYSSTVLTWIRRERERAIGQLSFGTVCKK